MEISIGNALKPVDPFPVGILSTGAPVGEEIGHPLPEEMGVILDPHKGGVVLHADHDDLRVDVEECLLVNLE